VDAQGNALAMTTTIEDAFGARQMVTKRRAPRGLPAEQRTHRLQLRPTDADGKPIANRVQPGKRPTLVHGAHAGVRQGQRQFLLSGGSPGGAADHPLHVAKTLYGTLNWGLNPQRAIDLPNFGSLNGPSLLEEKRFPPRRWTRCARAAPRCASRT
jgi:gamma-glutamyltranspeptidase/glutathione hydrolase